MEETLSNVKEAMAAAELAFNEAETAAWQAFYDSTAPTRLALREAIAVTLQALRDADATPVDKAYEQEVLAVWEATLEVNAQLRHIKRYNKTLAHPDFKTRLRIG